MNDQETDFLEDTEIEIKPTKKQLSEQKLQHLANIRVKALEKKKEMKQITEKAKKLKEIESHKEMKKIQKEQLAKQYDELIANAKPKEETKPKEEIKPKEEEIKPKEEEEIKPKQQIIKKEETKPIKKKRIIKKIVYQEASSSESDSDDADEVEVVKVKKNKNKKQQPPQPQPQPQKNYNDNNSYSNLLYESSIDNLKKRMMDERARSLVMSVMPSYG